MKQPEKAAAKKSPVAKTGQAASDKPEEKTPKTKAAPAAKEKAPEATGQPASAETAPAAEIKTEQTTGPEKSAELQGDKPEEKSAEKTEEIQENPEENLENSPETPAADNLENTGLDQARIDKVIVDSEKGEQTEMYVVVKKFVDAPQYRVRGISANEYLPGDNVSHFDSKRLKNLEKRKFVEKTVQQ